MAFVSGSELRVPGGSLRSYNSYICGNMEAWTERNRDQAEQRQAFESSEFYWQESGWVRCSAALTCYLPIIKKRWLRVERKARGHSWEPWSIILRLWDPIKNSQYFFLVILEFLRTSDPRASRLSTFEQDCAQWLSYACLTTACWMCVERKLFSLVLHA